MKRIVQAGEKKRFCDVFSFFFGSINEQIHSCVVFSSNQGEPYTCYHRIYTVVFEHNKLFYDLR